MLEEKLQGKRITLERARGDRGTAEKSFNCVEASRAEFLPWLDWVAETKSPDDTYDFLKSSEEKWNEKKEFVYTIRLQGELIGFITVLDVSEEDKRCAIGYWMSTPYSGQGYMPEAVSILERELFAKGFNRIVIHTDVLNLRSASVPKKLGYVHEGVLREVMFSKLHNRFRSINTFSKLRSDLK